MATTLMERNLEYIPKEMENIVCLICGEKKYNFHEKIGYKKKFQYVECINCNNVYLNPRPKYDEEFVNIAYDQYAQEVHHYQNKGLLDAEEEDFVKRSQVVVKYIMDKYIKSGKILDLGCGTGIFLIGAKRLGWDPYGIDISKPMVDHVNNSLNIPAVDGQFEDLDLRSWGKFDIIYSSHVIEHIPNPNKWMQVFKKYLKSDGYLVLNVPNQYAPEKILQRFLKTIGIRKDIWAKWRTPDHLYEPHFKSMKYLFDKNGFEIVDYFTYSSQEKENDSFVSNFFHKKLKFGSKLRFILKPKAILV